MYQYAVHTYVYLKRGRGHGDISVELIDSAHGASQCEQLCAVKPRTLRAGRKGDKFVGGSPRISPLSLVQGSGRRVEAAAVLRAYTLMQTYFIHS